MMHASGEIRRRTIEIQQGERQRNQTQTLQVPVQCCSVKRGRYVSFLVRQRARHNHWGPCNLHCICMMHVGSCLNLIIAMNRSEWIAMQKLTFRPLSLSLFPVNIGGFSYLVKFVGLSLSVPPRVEQGIEARSPQK